MAQSNNEKKQPKLSLKDFRRWLEAKPNAAVVGYTFRCTQCPIAQYFRERFDPFPMATVGPKDWSAGARNNVKLPKWARQFVLAVDRVHPVSQHISDGFRTGEMIRKEQALEVLNGITKL